MNHINSEQETNTIVAFIQQTFETAGFADAVIGLSGGVDSAVSCMLAVRALGVEHVYPILLPYGSLNTRGVLDAMECIEKTKISLSHVVRIDIQHAVNEIVKVDPFMDKERKGNVMARVRMTHLFDQAKKRHALVVGTENKSEYLLGYFTRFGDEASDIEPIIHLYKTQVFELAAHLDIPKSIFEKAPSADLWPEQTDEKDFGFKYAEIDEALLQGASFKGSTTPVVEKVLSIVKKNNFKHHVPICIEK